MSDPSRTEMIDIRAPDLNDPPGVENPYWAAVRVLPGDDISARYENRWEPAQWSGVGRRELIREYRSPLAKRYAWAITDPASVAFVVDALDGRGVVEIGAGTGYWAWQLSQRGVNVIAYDEAPPDQVPNDWHFALVDPDGDPYSAANRKPQLATWHPVIRGGPEAAAVYPDRALLLCWPPYDTDMAADALAAYSGGRVVYIGEGEGGCTGNERFHNMLEAFWEAVGSHRPIQWCGLHDWITVYQRTGRDARCSR